MGLVGCDITLGLQHLAPDDAGTSCVWSAWSEPHQLPSFTSRDHDPTTSTDRLELLYAHDTGTGFALYHATRTATSEAFAGQAALGEVAVADPALTGDGLEVFAIASSQPVTCSRASTSAAFESCVTVSGFPGAVALWITADARQLYYVGSHVANVYELRVQSRASTTDAFGGDSVLGTGLDHPAISSDGLDLYATRPPLYDSIIRRSRPSVDATFETSSDEPVIVGTAPSISRDGTTLVFENATGFAELDRTCR